jgi:hypothetical protein
LNPQTIPFETTLVEMIGAGYLVSFDVPTNPTTEFDPTLWAQAAVGNIDVLNTIIEYVGLSMIGNQFDRSVASMVRSFGMLFREPLPVGSFTGKDGTSHDTREIDFLSMLSHEGIPVEEANAYQDAMFGTTWNQRMPQMPNPSEQRSRYRRMQDRVVEHCQVIHTNAAYRLVMDTTFVGFLHEVAARSPMRFLLVNNKPQRPTISPAFITRPAR